MQVPRSKEHGGTYISAVQSYTLTQETRVPTSLARANLGTSQEPIGEGGGRQYYVGSNFQGRLERTGKSKEFQ